ncbi:MAG: hypothetical protein V2A34_04120 [Lentisphaerota bacterium]
MSTLKHKAWRVAVLILSLWLASIIWLPLMHVFFTPGLEDYFAPDGLPRKTRMLAAYQMGLWTHPDSRVLEIARMRTTNAEWDFMGRTFLVLALANIGMRDPSQKTECLDIMDRIIDETLKLEAEKGQFYFLMDYAKDSPFRVQSARSLFVDGEIALMMASRRFLEEKAAFQQPLRERIDSMIRQMEKSPMLCGESYPDECWTFCNAVAVAAIRMSDLLDQTDHKDFAERWLAVLKNRLLESKTGILYSCFLLDGTTADGPEGSTIWLVAHCLQILDPAFALDQYERAKKELAARVLGFGYAREWPLSWKGLPDVDSGPILPFGISAGSSGMAVLGAAAFNDREYLKQLLASLRFGGFPVARGGKLRFAASNQVGDAVLLYALVQGPLWKEVLRRMEGGAL